MEEFSFSTRIFFGEGALERLRRVQDKKVMIVTDRFMAGIGVPDKVAQKLMGHADITTTRRIYQQLREEEDLKYTALLDNYLEEKEQSSG